MKKTLGQKIRQGVVLFTLVLTSLICLVVGLVYRDYMVRQYRFEGRAITGSLASNIDGTRALSYLETGRPDEYYQNVLDGIQISKEKFELTSVAVAVPREESLQFIWLTDYGPEIIGTIRPYASETDSWLKSIYQGTQNDTLHLVNDPEYGRMAVAADPIPSEEGNTGCIVFAIFSVADISHEIVSAIWKIVLVILALRGIYLVMFYRFFQRNVVDPVKTLTKASGQILENLENGERYRNEIHTGDEMEELSLSMEKMDGELRNYLRQAEAHAAEKERNRTELEMAAQIQEAQLPNHFPAFPERRDFDIHALMKPAKSVAGDFYDFFLIDDEHLAMVVADVSGKGVPASLFMMISRVMIKYCLKEGFSPAETLRRVNNQLMENNEVGEFVTVWLAVLDLGTGEGTAANAGHEHPALRDTEGMFSLVEYKHSPPVAIARGDRFTEHGFRIQPGECLFVYTDGVPEASDPNGKFYGTDRMLRALNRYPDADPRQVIDHVYQNIQDFVGDADQFDDITMLCFTWKPESITGQELTDGGK